MTEDKLDQVLALLRGQNVVATTRAEEAVDRVLHAEKDVVSLIAEQSVVTAGLVKDMQKQMDEMYAALTGDNLHPNGLLIKVKAVDAKVHGVEKQVVSLREEWHDFRSRIKGIGIGIAIGSGVLAGSLAAILNDLIRGLN